MKLKKKLISLLLDEIVINLSQENDRLRTELEELKHPLIYTKVEKDDSAKLREDLFERLKHLESRMHEMTVANMNLAKENAEFKVLVDIYKKEIKDFRLEIIYKP